MRVKDLHKFSMAHGAYNGHNIEDCAIAHFVEERKDRTDTDMVCREVLAKDWDWEEMMFIFRVMSCIMTEAINDELIEVMNTKAPDNDWAIMGITHFTHFTGDQLKRLREIVGPEEYGKAIAKKNVLYKNIGNRRPVRPEKLQEILNNK